MFKKALIAGAGVIGLTVLLFAVSTDTRLADAAQSGDLNQVRALLKQNVNVNAAQGDGSTALHWAVFQDDLEMAKVLLAAGADVKAVTRLDSLTPLHAACKNGSFAMIDTLLKAGADPNKADGNGTTPLMFASAAGNVEAVNLLLTNKVDVNARDTLHGQTALMFAAALDRAPAIRTLMDHGADAKITSKVATQERVRLDQDGNPVTDDKQGADKQGKAAPAADATKCAPAAETEKKPEGDAKMAETAKADTAKADAPPAQGRGRNGRGGGGGGAKGGADTAKGADTKGGDAKGADAKGTDAKGGAPAPEESASLKAVADLRTFAQSLLTRVDDLEKQIKADEANQAKGGAAQQREKGASTLGGMTALLFAAREGHVDAAHALLEKGADINQVNAGDKTSPLVMAIMNGHFDLGKDLVGRGADPNLADELGLTALYATVDVAWAPKSWFPQPITAQEKVTYLELMKDLLDRGANPNARLGRKLWFRSMGDRTWVDPSGATALWRAAVALDVPAMRLLVGHGADPDLPTKGGDTLLMVTSGLGWGANFSTNVPDGWMDAVKYALEVGGDVNAKDSRGYTALHGASYIGNNELINFLVSKGADVKAVATDKNTVADMANGPNRYGIPHAETVALLEKLGSENSHNCRSDQCLVAARDDSKDGGGKGGGRGGRGGGRGGGGGGGAAATDAKATDTKAAPATKAGDTVAKLETCPPEVVAKPEAVAKVEPH